MTNIDVFKGKLKQIEGKAEAAYGELADDPRHKVKGKIKEAEGKVQEGYGKAKEAVKDAIDGKK